MKRLVIVMALIAAGFVGLGTQHTALAAKDGNSAAAHACGQGGYANLLGSNGLTEATFSNTGECASYAAQGGTLVSATDAAPCLNGGYAGLTSSNPTDSFVGNGTAPFPSEAACVLYIGQGGQPVPFQQTSRTGTGIIWGD
jgi:hypothetical protein